jgi:hypothetical protein
VSARWPLPPIDGYEVVSMGSEPRHFIEYLDALYFARRKPEGSRPSVCAVRGSIRSLLWARSDTKPQRASADLGPSYPKPNKKRGARPEGGF